MNDIIETKNSELIKNVTDQISSINNFIKWGDSHLQERADVIVVTKHPIMSLEEFAQRARAVHDDKYNFSHEQN